MKLALIGYGKMGKAIEVIAKENGDEIVLKISSSNKEVFTINNIKQADVAIEFTNPHSAAENIIKCFDANVPVVSGSTGWLQQWSGIEAQCKEKNGTLLYASNFSIGVNLFFELNKFLATLMRKQEQYNVTVEEIHHTQKKDSPSGTAISLAEQIIQEINLKKRWVNQKTEKPEELQIITKRINETPGAHRVLFHSPNDDIEIIHTAHSRKGFAAGALLAASFVIGKKGIFNMQNVLGLK